MSELWVFRDSPVYNLTKVAGAIYGQVGPKMTHQKEKEPSENLFENQEENLSIKDSLMYKFYFF